MLKFLQPLIDQRQAQMSSGSEGLPFDYLSWIMEASPPGFVQTPEHLSLQILQINFASMGMTALALTHALYYLAANPNYAEILRQEIDEVIAEDGWTKASMQKLRRVDSFFKESSRINPGGPISVSRYTLQDYTFKNGLKIPKGNFITASTFSTHFDEEIYRDARTFNPWRFSDAREDEAEAFKHQYSTTTLDYLAFGAGKHACPGRFFAANELKAIFSYIVSHYDVKTEVDGLRPPNEFFATAIIPNTKARVLFRPRQKS